MGRVVRLTEQELRGIVTDLIKMALSGDIMDKETPQDSENDNKSTNDKVSLSIGQSAPNPYIISVKSSCNARFLNIFLCSS